jgi:hypothetical protein
MMSVKYVDFYWPFILAIAKKACRDMKNIASKFFSIPVMA